MKCPACGFETPDEQAWCDFCKEPLRKRKPAAAAAPQPTAEAAPEAKTAASVPAAKSVPVPEEVWQRLMSVRAQNSPASVPGEGIPPEFAGLDTGGSLPPVPPIIRKGAWVFLGICVVWIFVAIFWMIRNSDRIASNVSTAAPLPTAAPAPAPDPSPQDPPGASPDEAPAASPDAPPPSDGGTL